MTDDGDGSFLGRWSRRKHAARRGEALPEPEPPAPPASEAAAAAPVPAPSVEAPAPELPPIDSLKGLESDYEDFLRPDVDPATRSAALRKLFSDQHFNQMDGLDVYIDDYTKADPIPNAMLRVMSQARSLGLFEEEEKKAERPEGEATPEPISAQTAAIEAPAGPTATPDTVEPPPAEETPPKTSDA